MATAITPAADDGVIYPLNSIEHTQKLMGNSGRSSIYNMIAAGELQAVKLNSRTMVVGDSIRDRIARLPHATIGIAAVRAA